MKYLTDKLLICILCFICFCAAGTISAVNVTSLLCAVIITSINAVCSSMEKTAYKVLFCTANLAYLVLCFVFPEFTYLIPLILYDFVFSRYRTAAILFIVAFLSNTGLYSVSEIIMWIILSAAAVYLRINTCSCTKLEDELITTRDMITEKNIALAAKNKSLLEKQEYEIKLATLNERNRIAGDIHDHVGHMLSRSILQIGALLVLEKDTAKHEALESIKSTLDGAMTSIRQSVHDLHNDSIDLNSAVFEAVSALPDNITRQTDCDRIENMPQNIKFCIISVIKEAVSNIIRHSNADHVTLILREHPAFYQLLIKDNGSLSQNCSVTGMGLENMKNRIESLGGTFSVQTDNGYKLFISIPKGDAKL